jgi:hypothetical protein
MGTENCPGVQIFVEFVKSHALAFVSHAGRQFLKHCRSPPNAELWHLQGKKFLGYFPSLAFSVKEGK